jgi:hypothetical protein
MGVNTQLLINSKYQINDIVRVIERTRQTKVTVNTTHDYNYLRLSFKDGVTGEERDMSIFLNCTKSIGNFTLLDLGMWGSSVGIMENIAEVFGGLICENDCEDKWEFINGVMNENNSLFLWKEGAIEGKINTSSDVEKFYNFHKDWDSKHKK